MDIRSYIARCVRVSININHLADEIARELARYTKEVEEEMEVAKEEVSDLVVAELRRDPSPRLTGDYRRGWRKKRFRNKIIIHNKTNYQLTHLLEKGHAKVGGGRTEAIPHIRPAEQRAIARYVGRIERALQS
jgi:hypothetical protein